ncbi:STAS domain-containing protein [Bounagaea algeriensis]
MHSPELTRQTCSSTTSGSTAHPEPAVAGTWKLRVTYPTPRLAIVHVAGDLDAATTPSLAASLWPRLHSTLAGFVIDLREVAFLGVAGLELLAAVHSYTDHRGMDLGIVNSTRVVDRALAVGGLERTLPCYPTLETARTALLSSGAPAPREGS